MIKILKENKVIQSPSKYIPKDLKSMTIEKLIEYMDKDVCPDKWYLHGSRVLNKDLSTDIAQCSTEWETALSYGQVCIYVFAPIIKSTVIDCRDRNTREQIISIMKKDYENGVLDYQAASDIEGMSGNFWRGLSDSLNPKNIVNSAEFYDNPNFMDWIYDQFNPDIIIVNEGAVVADENIYYLKLIKGEHY
jgi:uncharacterized protein YeeX (DUF496 family)